MQYISTRNKNKKYSAAEVIKMGISPEGGLFVPEEKPTLTQDEFKKLANMPYWERAANILHIYLSDFTLDELKTYTQKAYASFDNERTVPMTKLNDKLFVQELWHGPTCAFKDVALQLLPYLMTASAKKVGNTEEIVILTATSGDTGKAALEGFADVEGTKIIVFYPKEGVSAIQKQQMVTQEGGNVCVVAVDGNFDDAQTGVKQIFTNDELNQWMSENGFTFSSANSINWGRLAPQIVYYVSAYVDLVKNGELNEGESFNVCVPTGNFGNILASYYAKEMGVPINLFICASNANNVLTDFFNTGEYNKNRAFYQTTSPSMDILVSSNLERLLFEMSGQNDKQIATWMEALNSEGIYTIESLMNNDTFKQFRAFYANDEKTGETIKATFDAFDYVMDTHTAVGMAAIENTDTMGKITVLASTASPYKFAEDVLTALGSDVGELDSETQKLKKLQQLSEMVIPTSLAELEKKQVYHETECKKDNMDKVIIDFLTK